jgi:hypothetical protein
MLFKVHIKSPAVREDTIRQQINAATDTEPFHGFRNHESQLKRVRLPQDVLVYRMENFRTFTEQQTYLAREKKPQSFFVGGQENESVQQVQHDILAVLAGKGVGESVVPVSDVLRKEGQRDPLLITNRGVVVNGNRRLAAMRELLAEDGAAFEEFNYIKCIVLPPDATAEEIVDIEAVLQGRPETKLEYDWIGGARLIKRLIDMGRSEKDVAMKLNRKPTEVRNSLLALTEAELYLKDWKKKPGEYTLVRDSEQFFKDLPDELKGKDSELSDASRVIAWTLLDNKGKLNDRLYAFNAAFGKSAADVLDRLSTEAGIAIAEEQDDQDDEFTVDIEASPREASYQPLTEVLRTAAPGDEIVDRLIEISRGVIEEERGKRQGGAALKAVGVANARLTEVDLGNADAKTYQGIVRQLDQILKRAEELKNKTKELIEADKKNSAPEGH